jgi:hypothetical protein
MGGLRIRVGLYPPTSYVIPPAEQEFAAAAASIEQTSKEYFEKLAKEADKQDEEAMKHMTPEQAIALKARIEQSKKDEALREERLSGPCKPLVPAIH